ncbi:MAG: ATP-binding cassette domain-containing protein, partial [Tardiphaga sp.]|uniref:ABC transporter substrate-binding protein n=1 Tax=Tardiphaga sp. TaxID=1926292 RepID=UPI00199F5AC2
KRVIWRMVPQAGNRRALLERGDADMSYELPYKDFQEIKANGKLKVVSLPFSNGIQYIGMNVTKPPFDNPKVRQALAYAIPYQKIVDAVLFGLGNPMYGASADRPTEVAWPQPTKFNTDIAKAKALLAEAGYPNGFETTLSFRAVDGISFTVGHGESVGLVGESGCGKSTTSMMVMRLIDKTSGNIVFDGDDIGAMAPNAFARLPLRKSIQMVFQDPTDSLNPRFTAARAIADPLMQLGDIRGGDALRAKCEDLARQVGLPLDLLDRFPHQMSGGQKARVGIARAIALQPKLTILDEPTAALDVSVQAVVLNLLQDLKQSMGMSYLFVSHDLNVVRLLCDRVIVMRSGRIVEQGPTEAVLDAPQDDYTRELLSAIPHPPLPVH